MSAGERNLEELKSLVVHTLETNGVLGQIRAQLRANVYKAIDCEEEQKGEAAVSGSAKKLMKSPEGRLMAEIVAEFFEFYEFRHSLSVFVPESTLGRERRTRNEVGVAAGLDKVGEHSSILEQLVGLASGPDLNKGAISSASSTTASSPPPGPLLSAMSRPSPANSPGDSTSFGQAGKSDCDTPPDGHRSRPASGAAATAIESAISAGLGGTAAAASDPVADSLSDDGKEAPEETTEEPRRNGGSGKPRGKLPSLAGGVGNTSSLPSRTGGKELLPPLTSDKASPEGSIGGISGAGGAEEVSLAESAGGCALHSSTDSLFEEREDIRRLGEMGEKLRAVAAGGSTTAAGSVGGEAGARGATGGGQDGSSLRSVSPAKSDVIEEVVDDALIEEVADEVDNLSLHSGSSAAGGGAARSLPRSASGSFGHESPARSPAQSHSPFASEPVSELPSPAGSSASGSRSIEVAAPRPASNEARPSSQDSLFGRGVGLRDDPLREEERQSIEEAVSIEESMESGSFEIVGNQQSGLRSASASASADADASEGSIEGFEASDLPEAGDGF